MFKRKCKCVKEYISKRNDYSYNYVFMIGKVFEYVNIGSMVRVHTQVILGGYASLYSYKDFTNKEFNEYFTDLIVQKRENKLNTILNNANEV